MNHAILVLNTLFNKYIVEREEKNNPNTYTLRTANNMVNFGTQCISETLH